MYSTFSLLAYMYCCWLALLVGVWHLVGVACRKNNSGAEEFGIVIDLKSGVDEVTALGEVK